MVQKRRDLEKVIRKPANIILIDASVTRILIAPEVQWKPMEDLKTGRTYEMMRGENGIQVT